MKDWLNIDKLEYNTYDEYKDSKIELIGNIPRSFKTNKVKNELKEAKYTTVEEGLRNYLEIGDINIKNKDYDIKNKEKLTVKGAKKVPINTILVSTVRPNRGAITYTKEEGVCVSTAFTKINMKNKYYFYYLNRVNFFEYLINNSQGSTYPICKDYDVLQYHLCVPSKKEQLSIVKFLDEKTTIIDKKIEILKKQNELEKELEKVLINQCVTKGVDSFTKLDKDGNLIDFENKLNRNKEEFDLYMNENGYIDSKVEWLGYININCKLSKMKFEVKNANNGKNNSNDTPVLSLTKTGVKIKTDITFGKCATSYIGHQIVNIGNFVFSPRDYDQTPIVSGVCYDYGCTSNLYMVFNVNCDNISEYINIWFWNLKYLVNYFENFSQGMRYSFNGKTFGEIPFIKYNKKEQFKIIKFLDSKAQILEQKRIKREIEITLLEEYKKTLINDVVTGKIKVIKC